MQKRLYRSARNKMIGGVAAGLAEYFDVDPVIFRILFVVVALMGGWGFIAYIICWIIIPQEPLPAAHGAAPPQAPTPEAQTAPPPSEPSRGHILAGIALIVIGVLFLADNLFPRIDLADYWPAILIVLGGAILLRSSRTT